MCSRKRSGIGVLHRSHTQLKVSPATCCRRVTIRCNAERCAISCGQMLFRNEVESDKVREVRELREARRESEEERREPHGRAWPEGALVPPPSSCGKKGAKPFMSTDPRESKGGVRGVSF